jgi:PAS domain S-box-containing protein
MPGSDRSRRALAHATPPQPRGGEASAGTAARLADIVDLADDAIITVDERYRILQFNLGATSIFGYAPGDVVGQPLAMLLPARVRGVHEVHMRQFASTPDSSRQMGSRQEICGLRQDGTEFPAEASISKVLHDGIPLFTVWLRDVTIRRRDEAAQAFLAGIGSALGSSLDYLPTLARAVRTAIPILGESCLIDIHAADGDREVTVADADPEQEDLARAMRRRYPPLYDSPALQHARDAGQPHLLAALDDTILSGLTVDQHHSRFVKRLGWISALFVPIAARGHVLGVLTCCSRTRELRQADLVLATELAHRAALAIDNALLYRRAQQATRTRDEVLGIVSHDLRSALSTISLCAGALADPVPAPIEGVHAMADAIRHSTDWAQRLIRDLVDVTSLEAGSLALHRRPVRPSAVLDRAYESFRPHMERAGLEFRLAGDPDLATVDADEARLLQVLFNLLTNAVKHTRAGGVITLSAARHEAATSIVFSVEDTGSGIPEPDLPYLFDRFWQSHRSQRGGSGLGLAIAKGIVDSHGGGFTVVSVPGAGSTFSFTVPVAEEA